MTEITEGRPAPPLDLPTDGGGRASLAALRSRWVVVYFYPKADTPGCTTEGRDFSALVDDFEAAGATVIGVSRDPVRKLERFKARHELTVTLASDEGGEVTEAWGVWIEKSLYGRKYMGVERATFLVDPEGRIARAWRKTTVKGHAAAVLSALREAQEQSAGS